MDEKTIELLKAANIRIKKTIQEMGFEKYIAESFAREIRIVNMLLGAFFLLLGGVLMFFCARWGLTAEINNLDELLGNIYIGLLMFIPGVLSLAYSFYRFRRITQADITSYKERLTQRHGDYRKVLKEIEATLGGDDDVFPEVGSCFHVTRDMAWVIVMSFKKGVHFFHKSEIACMITYYRQTGAITRYSPGSHTYYAKIIIDSGESFVSSDYEDNQFMLMGEGNPFMLSNNDLVENSNGKMVTAINLNNSIKNEKIKNELIAKQYLENKKAGIMALWARN